MQADGRLRVNFQLDTLAVNSKLPDGVAVYEALKRWIVHMHVHLSAQRSEPFREERNVLTAQQRDNFAGFVSIEQCSGGGDPREAALAGMRLLREMN